MTTPAMPDIEFIKAGTMDDTSGLEPTVEFYARSAQAWEPPVPGAQRLETVPAELTPPPSHHRRASG